MMKDRIEQLEIQVQEQKKINQQLMQKLQENEH